MHEPMTMRLRSRLATLALAVSSAVLSAAVVSLFPTVAASSAVLTRATSTRNWSGCGLAGSGFTGVTGTFAVPAPLSSPSCLEETAVWAGVDGLHNHDLLQAGIAETGFAPATTRAPP
jgi:Peptidase A4 family